MNSAVPAPSEGAREQPVAGETTLESFVAQLHRDGVVAGQQEAERLLREAHEEAAEVVRRAGAEANALLAEARAQASRQEERSRAELQLAARDTLLHLQSAIERVFTTLLQRTVGDALRDGEFLRQLLKEVVSAYARADAAGRPVALNLPHGTASQLHAWTAELLEAGLRSDVEVSATMRGAGFEYRLTDGGVVEVSTEAIVEQLVELVRPQLREIVLGAGGAHGGPLAPAVTHPAGPPQR